MSDKFNGDYFEGFIAGQRDYANGLDMVEGNGKAYEAGYKSEEQEGKKNGKS